MRFSVVRKVFYTFLHHKKYIISIAISSIVITLLAAGLLVKTEERTQLRMGTFVKIVLQGPPWIDFDAAFAAAFNAVDEIDAMASAYNSKSELSRLNQNAHSCPVVVSDALFGLIRDSVRLSHASDGALDITVAPLVRLWDSFREKQSIPPDYRIARALSLVGHDRLILDVSRSSVYFSKKGMAIDLSAIAKGHAVDRAVSELKRCGFRSAIVNAGGDLYCLGRRNLFQKWRIGIRDPRAQGKLLKVLYLSDSAVATSGGYEQYFTYKGKAYSHLIDPRTGSPIEGRSLSVTVVAPECTLADGIATAVGVGGEPVETGLRELYPGIEIIAVYE